VVYRDKDATLTDARVETAHAAVLRELENRFGAVRR
jgi:phenylalanyl-tRNA synthetase beta subunit